MNYSYKFVAVAALFVTCLLAANILIVKQIDVFGLTLPAAIIIFPLSYVFGDILTEVYGYAQARRVIWLGFFCNLLLVIAIWIVQILPAASVFDAQAAYVRILGNTPRFLVASFLAYLAGEFLNSYVLAKMKILTKGKWLWTRTISSTVAGQGVDTIIVLSIGFYGTLPGGSFTDHDALALDIQIGLRDRGHAFHLLAGRPSQEDGACGQIRLRDQLQSLAGGLSRA